VAHAANQMMPLNAGHRIEVIDVLKQFASAQETN
jgi:hypothetical protein